MSIIYSVGWIWIESQLLNSLNGLHFPNVNPHNRNCLYFPDGQKHELRYFTGALNRNNKKQKWWAPKPFRASIHYSVTFLSHNSISFEITRLTPFLHESITPPSSTPVLTDCFVRLLQNIAFFATLPPTGQTLYL